MILFVSLHHVIGKTFLVENFKQSEKNIIQEKHIDIQSEGLNIALCSKILQTEPFMLSSIGGMNGRYIKNYISMHKIKSELLHLNRNTIESIQIVDTNSRSVTSLESELHMLDEKNTQTFITHFRENLKKIDIVFFDSCLHNYMTQDSITQLYAEAKRNNVRVFKNVVNPADPNLNKNYYLNFEKKMLESLGVDLSNFTEIQKFIENYFKQDTLYISVNLYKDGVYLFSKDSVLYISPVFALENRNEVYANQAFIAGMMSGFDKRYEKEKMLRTAYATLLMLMQKESILEVNRQEIFFLRNKTKTTKKV